MSSYLVLARKLRPQTFEEVVGQTYTVKALCNAARSGKLAHALLFTGPRGVGKTSTARIVAKTVNCDNSPAESRPCGGNSSCESCSLISDGRAVEVQEMDAASHTSVNNVRDIIEKSRYLPASGKTKVYIIDETHMLSHAAFNALLKTLEEPPAHVLFILATTEPHKIPATILSRCQRYDFKKVSVEEISSSLEAAAKSENIKIVPETVSTIALESDGSLRDALSLLDQLVATFGTDIDHSEALSLLGIVDSSLMNGMFETVMKRDPAKGIEILGSAVEKGISPAKFAEGLTSLIRTVLILKLGGKNSVPGIPKERSALLLSAAHLHSAEDLEMLFDISIEACDRVNRSFYPEMAVEAMVMKLCSLEKTVPLDDIMDRLNKLSDRVGSEGESPAAKAGGTVYQSDKKIKNEEVVKEEETGSSEYGAARETPEKEKNAESFADFLKLGDEDFGYMAHMVPNCEIKIEDSAAVIKIAENSVMLSRLSGSKETRERFLRAAESFFGRRAEIEISAAAPKEECGNGIEKIQNQPIVRRALDMFDGKIKNLAEEKAE